MSFAPFTARRTSGVLAQPCLAAPGVWEYTGSLNVNRSGQDAVLLQDGRVLITGGTGTITSAEVYTPVTGTWSVTGSLNHGRYLHTATLLPDGRVLVAGGNYIDPTTAELYDPATGIWTLTGSLHTGRSAHTATLLGNGKVLVAGATRVRRHAARNFMIQQRESGVTLAVLLRLWGTLRRTCSMTARC